MTEKSCENCRHKPVWATCKYRPGYPVKDGCYDYSRWEPDYPTLKKELDVHKKALVMVVNDMKRIDRREIPQEVTLLSADDYLDIARKEAKTDVSN